MHVPCSHYTVTQYDVAARDCNPGIPNPGIEKRNPGFQSLVAATATSNSPRKYVEIAGMALLNGFMQAKL